MSPRYKWLHSQVLSFYGGGGSLSRRNPAVSNQQANTALQLVVINVVTYGVSGQTGDTGCYEARDKVMQDAA